MTFHLMFYKQWLIIYIAWAEIDILLKTGYLRKVWESLWKASLTSDLYVQYSYCGPSILRMNVYLPIK